MKSMKFCSAVPHRRNASCLLVVLAGFVFSDTAFAELPVMIGGAAVAGNQVTVTLADDVPSPLSYDYNSSNVPEAVAYFDWHVFCAQTAATSGSMRLSPRYQLPSPAVDVWKFASTPIEELSYDFNGGGLLVRINNDSTVPRMRCLSALPGAGGSSVPWTVNRGLFGDGFGDYVGGVTPLPTAPTGPHQNVKVSAEQFPGLVAGREVVVVRIENQFDPANPAQVSWTLVEGFNATALSPPATGAAPDLDKATWCLLRPDWLKGTVPPAALCSDPSILFPGQSAQTTDFVRMGLGFFVSFPGPFHVLVSRAIHGTPAAGTPKQAFAALRTGGGLSGVAEEMQDWYPHDSVWYTY